MRNTYRSVTSAAGSWLIKGSSRWLEAATWWLGAKKVANPNTIMSARSELNTLDRFMNLILPFGSVLGLVFRPIQSPLITPAGYVIETDGFRFLFVWEAISVDHCL